MARKWKNLGTQIVLDSHEDEEGWLREYVLTPEDYDWFTFDPRPESISFKEARKLIRQFGPFAKSLSDQRFTGCYERVTILKIGRLTYEVENDHSYEEEGQNHEELFKTIVRNAKKLADLDLSKTPNGKELKILFGRKKITKVVAKDVDLSAAYECKVTDRIEELELNLEDSIEHLKSFEGVCIVNLLVFVWFIK